MQTTYYEQRESHSSPNDVIVTQQMGSARPMLPPLNAHNNIIATLSALHYNWKLYFPTLDDDVCYVSSTNRTNLDHSFDHFSFCDDPFRDDLSADDPSTDDLTDRRWYVRPGKIREIDLEST